MQKKIEKRLQFIEISKITSISQNNELSNERLIHKMIDRKDLIRQRGEVFEKLIYVQNIG